MGACAEHHVGQWEHAPNSTEAAPCNEFISETRLHPRGAEESAYFFESLFQELLKDPLCVHTQRDYWFYLPREIKSNARDV